MLGLGKTGTARATAAASSADSRVVYQHYAATLYRQALLTLDEDDARHRLAESVLRRFHQLVTGPARQDRRPGQRPSGQRPPGRIADCVDPAQRRRGARGLGIALGLRAVRALPDARRYVAMRKM